MIYFASDIHLGAGSSAEARATERAFCRWLDMVSEDATQIYLLGDIFDFWFEYKRVIPKGFVRVLGRLAELTDRGVRVVFFTGNHDMWCRDYLTKECGIEVYTNPRVMEVGGRVLHIAHGDNMNIEYTVKDFINYSTFEKGLSDRTKESYTNDLNIYKNFLKDNFITYVKDITSDHIKDVLNE